MRSVLACHAGPLLWLEERAAEEAHGAPLWDVPTLAGVDVAERVRALGGSEVQEHGVWAARGDVQPHATRLWSARISSEARPTQAGRWWSRTELDEVWSRARLAPLVPTLLEARDSGRVELTLEDEVQAWEVVPGIRMLALRTPTLPPATHTNAFVVGTGPFALIEPASPYSEEQEWVRRWLEGRDVVAAMLTHHHPDHAGGLEALGGLPLWAHPETGARLGVPLAHDLRDGDELRFGDVVLRCVFTPGHAAGHLCFFEPRSRTLLAGDMVAGTGTILIEPSEGDMIAYLDSLERLRTLRPLRILPAHGGLIADADGHLRHYRKHRLEREAKVLSALAVRGRAATPPELVPLAYADAPRAVWALAAQSVEAHLIKLEVERRVRRTEVGWVVP